jgi:DNA-binding HxlR family transcriptional regulator
MNEACLRAIAQIRMTNNGRLMRQCLAAGLHQTMEELVVLGLVQRTFVAQYKYGSMPAYELTPAGRAFPQSMS